MLEADDAIACMVTIFQIKEAKEAKEPDVVPPEVVEILDQFSVVFSEPKQLLKHRPWDHSIPLIPGAKPFNITPYRYTPEQKNEIEDQVKEMLKAGLIVPSTSPFSSQVLLVKKKDQTWRFCIDFRHLNMITIKNTYPLLVIDELLDELSGSRWFSKLDLRVGYHKIRLVEQDEEKTAFKTHQGHYQFRVLPYGVTGGPPTFQTGMNIVFAPLLHHGVLVFMDDILIHTRTYSAHLELLGQVLQLLKDNELFAKRSKCLFAHNSISYLGHKISGEGVATLEERVQTVKTWPRPQTVKHLRGFLGLAGYYRKFVKNFGILSRPLTDLLKKNSLFVWTPTTEEAFQALKRALVEAPVLALPDFSKPFVVETDASATGIGAVLMQDAHPVAYLSKALAPRNLGLSAYEKECLALLLAVDRWRPYLQHTEFLIRTDEKSLLNLTDQCLNTPVQQRAFTKLVGLQFKIHYKAGISNKAADALSRCSHDGTTELAAIVVCRPAWLEAVPASYSQDDKAQQLLSRLALSSQDEEGFTFHDGVIKFQKRIWIGNDTEIQNNLIKALHDSATGGHSGFHATYHRVRRLFAWKFEDDGQGVCPSLCHLPEGKDRAVFSSWTVTTSSNSEASLGSGVAGFH